MISRVDLVKAFGVDPMIANAIWKILDAAEKGHVTVEDALDDVKDRLSGDGNKRADFSNGDVRRFELSPSGGQWSGDEHHLGYFIDINDWNDITVFYLDGDYLKAHQEYDATVKKWKPAPRADGFYLTSQSDEEQAWRDWLEAQKTDQDYEDEGPDADSGCDLWTPDARHFYVYRYGNTSGSYRDKLIYTINVPVPWEAYDARLVALAERVDDIDGELETLDEHHPSVQHLLERRKALTDRLAKLRIARDEFPIPEDWAGSSEARDECERPGVWFHILKAQEKHGCYGHIWFREGSPGRRRDFDWKLLKEPKSYEYLARAQKWRASHRARKKMLADTLKAKAALIASGKPFPQRGDFLVHDLGYWMSQRRALDPATVWPFISYRNPGMFVYEVGSAAAPSIVSRADVAAGRGWQRLMEITGGRPLWEGTPFSPPETWQRVDTSQPLFGFSSRSVRKRTR